MAAQMNNNDDWAHAIATNTVTRSEIEWMISQRPLVHDLVQLKIDYGENTAERIVREFETANLGQFLPCLNWPGVGTRWEEFLQFVQTEQKEDWSAQSAFEHFANSLGRVVSYRCLALTEQQYELIKQKNVIWPSGRLKTGDGEEGLQMLRDLVNHFGVKKIAFARLYIGLRLIGKVDPSLSLHDDPETALTIAGGYVTQEKSPRLMGMNVPKIEALGYLLADLHAKGDEHWFDHRGVWFNGLEESCERYMLYEIPFFAERCVSQRRFTNDEEIESAIAPFRISQARKRAEDKGPHPPRGLERDDPLLQHFRR